MSEVLGGIVLVLSIVILELASTASREKKKAAERRKRELAIIREEEYRRAVLHGIELNKQQFLTAAKESLARGVCEDLREEVLSLPMPVEVSHG